MPKPVKYEHKFYLNAEQKVAFDAYCERTNQNKSSVVRELVQARLTMESKGCAVCADGRECIAPQIRMADLTQVAPAVSQSVHANAGQ